MISTSSTYTPVTADVGQILKVVATGTDNYEGTVEHTLTNAVILAASGAPIAPENFQCTEQGMNSVTLTWDSQSNLTHYTLMYRVSGTTAWSMWTPAPATSATTATITGLTTGTAYDFRLAAINTIGSKSSEITASTKSLPAPAPVKPKVKVQSKKATITSVTLTLSAPKYSTLDSNAKYIITCTSHPSIVVPPATGTSVVIEGLNPGKTYKFTVTAVNADGNSIDAKGKATTVKVTAKTPKYTVATMKADTKGTIVTGGDALGKTKTTIDSVTLTWMTAGRPVGEKLVVKVINAKTKQEVTANLEYSAGTDKNGKELSTLTFTGLKASTKYRVEVQAYTGESFEDAVHKSAIRKINISTAKFTAVSKVKAALSGDCVALNWTIPSKPANGAVYEFYEIDWVVSKTERQSVVIESVGTDGKSATVLLSTLESIGIDSTSTTKYNFVIRAVLLDGTTVINQSLDAKFALTPSKLV